MDKILIEGGTPLSGSVKISGAKNAALPLIFSTILSRNVNLLENVPDLADIRTAVKLLQGIGCQVEHTGNSLEINSSTITSHEAPYDLVRTMRASCLMMGPLLARYGNAIVSLPGGCAIGARPINLHLQAFEALGAKIELKHGYVHASAKKLHGAKIYFDTVTVTGTENAMMAAVLAKGETVIENAAMEPEIMNLAEALNEAGARIVGAGESEMRIQGVDEIGGLNSRIIPDRVEAGTFMVAGLVTGGDILIEDCTPGDLEIVILKLREMGASIETGQNFIRVRGNGKIHPVKIVTHPHPGFPTDMQAQFMVAAALADGTSIINEMVFENRFMHVSELTRMGSDISVDGHAAVVVGTPKLSGASVMATDLRASASLVLAGLVAEGETEVLRVYHLDRGYERMEDKLRKLGANIRREKA